MTIHREIVVEVQVLEIVEDDILRPDNEGTIPGTRLPGEDIPGHHHLDDADVTIVHHDADHQDEIPRLHRLLEIDEELIPRQDDVIREEILDLHLHKEEDDHHHQDDEDHHQEVNRARLRLVVDQDKETLVMSNVRSLLVFHQPEGNLQVQYLRKDLRKKKTARSHQIAMLRQPGKNAYSRHQDENLEKNPKVPLQNAQHLKRPHKGNSAVDQCHLQKHAVNLHGLVEEDAKIADHQGHQLVHLHVVAVSDHEKDRHHLMEVLSDKHNKNARNRSKDDQDRNQERLLLESKILVLILIAM